MAKESGIRLIANNKKAYHDYLLRTRMKQELSWPVRK